MARGNVRVAAIADIDARDLGVALELTSTPASSRAAVLLGSPAGSSAGTAWPPLAALEAVEGLPVATVAGHAHEGRLIWKGYGHDSCEPDGGFLGVGPPDLVAELASDLRGLSSKAPVRAPVVAS